MLLNAKLTIKSTVASLLLFFVLTMPSYGAVDKAALASQVKTKISFLETLLSSSNAQKLKTFEQGQALSNSEQLLEQAKNALNNNDPKLAEKLTNQGFSTFTQAVKSLQTHKYSNLNQNNQAYKDLRRTVTDRYSHLSSMAKSSSKNQPILLDKIATLLSSAEQNANKRQLDKAISQLNEAQKLINQALPKIKYSNKALASETAPKKAPPPAKKPVEVAKPVAVAKPSPVAQPKKPKPSSLSPKQKYQAERKRYQRHEKLVGPTLEKSNLSEAISLRLIKVADEAKIKADRARGQTIDGNYRGATRLMREATRELIKALDAAKK